MYVCIPCVHMAQRGVEEEESDDPGNIKDTVVNSKDTLSHCCLRR